MITIVNKRTDQGPSIYVGRPSALGNPFLVGRDGTRAEVIEKYRRWLPQAIQTAWMVREMFNDIVRAAASGDVVLSCWCAPLACHADVIREMVEDRLASRGPEIEGCQRK